MDGIKPALSPSVAKVLLRKSPLHAWQVHRLLGNTPSEPTDATDRGSVIDSLLLGPGGRDYIACDFKDWRTDKAKTERAAIYEAGHIPVLKHKLDDYVAVADRIRFKLADKGVKLAGHSHVTREWASDGVPCKGQLDHFEAPIIYDLKTCDSAAPADLPAKMVSLGHDVQGAAYMEAVEVGVPELAGRVRMVFLFCEVEAPYDVVCAELGGAMLELGRRKWKRAVKLWGECLAAGKWPGYEDCRPEPPAWALSQDMEQAMERMGTSDGVTF